MRNNKGLGRFETIIIILVLLIVFAFLYKVLIDSASGTNFNAMREDAISFGKTVSTNADFYHNSDQVSLGEAIGEGTIKEIKSPVSKGTCNESESKVVLHEGKYMVTLRCGDYIIQEEALNNLDKANVYEIKEVEAETANAEKVTLYNCEVSGKELFPEYYDELYFIYKVNKNNGSNHYNIASVDKTCKVIKKEVYREKVKVEE